MIGIPTTIVAYGIVPYGILPYGMVPYGAAAGTIGVVGYVAPGCIIGTGCGLIAGIAPGTWYCAGGIWYCAGGMCDANGGAVGRGFLLSAFLDEGVSGSGCSNALIFL
jgi:hypothetical protein